MASTVTSSFAPAWPHGEIVEVFPDIFVVKGTIHTDLMNAKWHFSRNMTIVREGNELSLINSVRLNEKGLEQLNSLGKVKNISINGDGIVLSSLRFSSGWKGFFSGFQLPHLPEAFIIIFNVQNILWI